MEHSVITCYYTCIADADMTRSIILIKRDGAVAWLCYVLCNEGANGALKVFIEMLAIHLVRSSLFYFMAP